jgi:hypothetical protein
MGTTITRNAAVALAVLLAVPASCGKSTRVAPHDSATGGTGGGIGGTDASLGTGGVSGADAPIGLADASPGTGGIGGMGAGGLIGGAGGDLAGGAGATVSAGGITGTGGSGGAASGGRTVGTGGSAGGGIGGNGGTVLGGSGGVGSGTSSTADGDAGQDSNGLCGSKACRNGEYCCEASCVSICMPEAHPCTGVVCSPSDAGYEVYPSDCQLRKPIGPDDPSCKTEPGRPNYYVCGPSLLGPPCVVQGSGLGTVGGNFCCP